MAFTEPSGSVPAQSGSAHITWCLRMRQISRTCWTRRQRRSTSLSTIISTGPMTTFCHSSSTTATSRIAFSPCSSMVKAVFTASQTVSVISEGSPSTLTVVSSSLLERLATGHAFPPTPTTRQVNRTFFPHLEHDA
ncbi:hypothetical protein MPH_08352 [Macrophomina phaseolina MS6]|uniref:Uncharacterized protein n=1 Tax=Macrophomina phaseolina (strain MS6) TaxID=1126212 RepID=K2RIT6_MACPH|nr:hypothetical protein MPH_08352 [Macrophomina phaseolina MS6]